MNITVQLLTDREFDSLPYKHLKESLGVADVEKGLAFVRQTGVKEWDLATITHEVNHLIEEHGGESADEDGIYHKSGTSGFGTFAPIGGFLGGIGSLLDLTGKIPFLNSASGGITNLLGTGLTALGASSLFSSGQLGANESPLAQQDILAGVKPTPFNPNISLRTGSLLGNSTPIFPTAPPTR